MKKNKLPDELKIEIEQRHIDVAKPGSRTCPIALAMQERFNCDIGVGFGLTGINNDTYSICKTGRDFIALFDNNYPVKPFILTLTKENENEME